MDRSVFFFMQSQQSSASNHDRYNKLTRADHAVTRITPVPSASRYKDQSSINISSSLMRWNTFGSSFLSAKPSTKIVANNSCNSCNLGIIMNSLPPLMVFFRLRVSMQKSCSFFVLCIILSYTHPPLLNLVCGMDRPFDRSW